MLKVGDEMPSLQLVDEGNKIEDPHWWNSAANMKLAVKTVRNEFDKLDAADQADFDKNAEAYLARLDALEPVGAQANRPAAA